MSDWNLNARADIRVPASLPVLALIALAVFLQFKSVPEQDLLIYACSGLLILGLCDRNKVWLSEFLTGGY
jgi:hypothetical protein